MTVYEFAPARLSTTTQRRLRSFLAVVAIVVLTAGVFVSWPGSSGRWLQTVLVVSAVALTATFNYRVSSIDQLFAFGLTASILATFGSTTNPLFTLSAWGIGVLIGHWILHRSLLLAAESTLCLWVSGIALLGAWQSVNSWLLPYQGRVGTALETLIALHIPQILAAILAFYLVRVLIATIRARIFTRLTLTEIWLRSSWLRIGIMLVAECVVASVVSASSAFLNTEIFQDSTPFGKTTLIILVATSAFGMASRRQARTARQRLNSLIDATTQLPWPTSTPINQQALQFARNALPNYQVSASEQVPDTARDHIHSIPVEGDGRAFTLFAVRRAGQPPFRLEDQRTLVAIASVANETIRGRKEVHTLRRLANTDRLTGLLNYRAFQVTLDELSDWHQPDELVALVFIDVDNFKKINDTYGHEVGNTVLRTVAQRIQSVVPEHGVLARVGGDEFVVLLQHLNSRAEAETVQRQMQEQVSQPMELDNTILSLRISQGVAFSTPGQQDLTQLVELADRHMYESRGSQLAATKSSSGASAEATTESGVALSLREGILQRRLRLVYQPIVDLRSQEVVAVEALVRYTDPTHGVLPVAFVLNEAERFGLLPELSEQLLELCIETLTRIRQRFPQLKRIHLNVSLQQLLDPTFTTMVKQITGEHPELELVLEVNESSLRESSADTIAKVGEFAHTSAAMLAFDDIGQAYTGFASLRDYPFLIWKVDRDVILHFSHERAETLVRALLAVTSEFGAELIFEGVESPQQNDWLLELGAKYAQGYLYGRPVSDDELLLRFETVGAAARL